MPDLLLEIGTEELPPHDIAPALQQLAEGMRAALATLRIDAGVIRTYGAPRRLAVVCMGVASRQRPMVREVRGPAAQAAFDAEGRPTQAAIGFARAQGVPVERLQAREVEGKRYAVAVVEERPKHSAEVLPGALTGVVTRLSFSKMMRWGEGEARFARPIRWMVALLGRTVLRVEVAGVRAGRTTRGHRILGSGPRAVASAQAYLKVLKSSGVIVDQDERRRVIVQQTTALAKQVSGVPVLDSALLDELIMSTEHPQALRGAFDREFLTLPGPVLVTVMQHHQKYFAIEDAGRRLLPYFLAVRDGDARHLATVRQGHEWVLRARLADARFFVQEDRKHRLQDYLPRLDGLLFQAQLGTMAEKTRRLVALARHVSGLLLLDGRTTEALLRAATLCKADLVTKMVGEFPELQGVIGQIYAELDGEPPEVARAIGEHYRPARAGDAAPKTQVGSLLGLVDKIDTLVGIVGVGLLPTGSQDPYGLRRAAQGIAEIIQMLRLRMPLRALAEVAAAGYGRRWGPEVLGLVVDFLRQRLRAMLIDQGVRYDLVDAAVAVSGDDLLAAADVLVHATGGVTCLEALARGCPIVAYGAPPGHAPLLAREMAALGLVADARSAVELRVALIAAATKPTVLLAHAGDAASLVLTAAPRVAVRLKARLARTAATAAALAVVLFALFASDATYPVVAEALALPESTSLSPAGHTVALVVRGRRRDLLALAPIARRDHLQASVAVSERLSAEDVAALRAAGLDPIPELRAGGVAGSLAARGQLQGQIARYQLRGRFYYLAPSEGFTITDYLLARELGGAPIQAGCDLTTHGRRDLGSLHPGEVVVATLGPDRDHTQAYLLASIRRLERAGLAVSSVQRLASGRLSS